MNFLKKTIALSISLCICSSIIAKESSVKEGGHVVSTETKKARQKRMQWWKKSRFGMFVHWGLYSSAEGEWAGKAYKGGGAEWIQKKANVPADEYEKVLLPKFKPSENFAKEWAALATKAGAKYVVFTNKHHEGFALHDSAITEYDAKDQTGRDLHKEITTALRAENLRVGVYHSLWDWHHLHAPAGRGAINVKGTSMEGRDLQKYRDYLHTQINEISDGRYGDIDILWLDYSQPRFQGKTWGAKEIYQMLQKNQKNVIINNRMWYGHGERKKASKYWTGDFSTPEQHVPSQGLPGVDWEVCDTLNITWGWSKHAPRYKSKKQLIHRLVDTVSKGGNYLLNLGPKPDGSIDARAYQLFSDVGAWMDVNGDAIYGTEASPFLRLAWGKATQKKIEDKTKIYLHVFDWPSNGQILIPGLKTTPSQIQVLGAKASVVKVDQAEGDFILSDLPTQAPNELATVIVLEFNEEVKIDNDPSIRASNNGKFTLLPTYAKRAKDIEFHESNMYYPAKLTGWTPNNKATFSLNLAKAGKYELLIEAQKCEVDFIFSSGGKTFTQKRKKLKWNLWNAGVVELQKGKQEIAVQIKEICPKLELNKITLTPKP